MLLQQGTATVPSQIDLSQHMEKLKVSQSYEMCEEPTVTEPSPFVFLRRNAVCHGTAMTRLF